MTTNTPLNEALTGAGGAGIPVYAEHHAAETQNAVAAFNAAQKAVTGEEEPQPEGVE